MHQLVHGVFVAIVLPTIVDGASPTPTPSIRACRNPTQQAGEGVPCGGQILSSDYVGLYQDYLCQTPECQHALQIIEADEPTECLYDDNTQYLLYADNLTPLKAHCEALKNGSIKASNNTTLPPGMVQASANATIPRTLPPRTPTPVADTPQPTASSSQSRSSSWSIITIATVGVVVSVVAGILLLHRRRRTMATKMYTMHTSPTTSQAQTTTNLHTGDFAPLLSTTVREHMEQTLAHDTTLEVWRLYGKITMDQRFLGNGSHAFVYLVTLSDGRQVASKRLAMDQATLAHLSQLIAEVHIVSTLRHTSIVEFVGVAWTSVMDFQVLFEYMERGDLRGYLSTTTPVEEEEDGSTWSAEKLRMALAIAEGLAYAHSFNPPLVHRDLKSRNILLTNDLRAKISDFGVARYQSDSCTMTTGVGTNCWLAPEVISGGGAYTELCDIYSFGVVLTELDTHEVPLAKALETAQQEGMMASELWLLRSIAKGELRPTISTTCPPKIRDLALRCLSFDPKDRPNALEVSFQLRTIVYGRATSLFVDVDGFDAVLE